MQEKEANRFSCAILCSVFLPYLYSTISRVEQVGALCMHSVGSLSSVCVDFPESAGSCRQHDDLFLWWSCTTSHKKTHAVQTVGQGISGTIKVFVIITGTVTGHVSSYELHK